jgi:hypothetical protein
MIVYTWTYGGIRVSAQVAVLGTFDQLVRISDRLVVTVHTKNRCLGGNVNLGRKCVIRLAEMNDAACLGPSVPVIVRILDSSPRLGINKEEVGHVHLVRKVGIELLDRLEKVVRL